MKFSDVKEAYYIYRSAAALKASLIMLELQSFVPHKRLRIMLAKRSSKLFCKFANNYLAALDLSKKNLPEEVQMDYELVDTIMKMYNRVLPIEEFIYRG